MPKTSNSDNQHNKVQQCCLVYLFPKNVTRVDILLHHLNNPSPAKLTLGHKSAANLIYPTTYKSLAKTRYQIIHVFIREVYNHPPLLRMSFLISVVVMVYTKELLQSLKLFCLSMNFTEMWLMTHLEALLGFPHQLFSFSKPFISALVSRL